MNTTKRIGFWLFIISILYAISPIISFLAASGIAALTGCNVNEGSVQVCTVLGMDLGGLLYNMAVSAWYLFVTVPIGAIGALAGVVLYIVAKVALWRRSRYTTRS